MKKLSVKEVEGFDEYMRTGFHDHAIKFPEAENTQFESGFDVAQDIAEKFLKSSIERARREERQRVVEMIELAKYKRELENRWVRGDGCWCNEDDAQLINEDLSDLQSKLEDK